MNKGQQQAVEYDELYTPAYAVKPLIQYIPEGSIIWECTSANNNIAKALRKNGFTVIETHINALETNFDFLEDKPSFDWDIIITNPPYSLKNQFLKRVFELGKPFAFLLPITTLTSRVRGELFREYGIQVLVLDTRIDFTGKKNNWFNASWFCWDLLPRDLVFAELKKEVV